MNFKVLPFLASAALALSISAHADEFDDFDSDSSVASGESAETSSTGETSADEGASEESVAASDSSSSYDGSTDAEFANDEEYAAAYARYKTEQTSKTEINRQRTEGFSRTIQLGVRASAGVNTFFGDGSDDWGFGPIFGGGLLLKMPLGVKNLSIVPELTFNYRYYSFETDTDFGTDDASINIMIFEIPLIVRYTFEDYNLYAGLGLNLALKLTGSSEYNQNFDGGSPVTDNNALVTSSVEVGGALDIGYMLTRYINIDVRVVQSFTNLLNEAKVPEGRFQDVTLRTFYTSIGVNYLF